MPAALANSISRPNTKPATHQTTDTGPAADARLKLLPLKAREKFERLRRAELLSRALADGLFDRIERTRTEMHDAQRDLGIFDRRWRPEAAFDVIEDEKTGKRERVPHIFPERVALLETIEAAKAELARLHQDQGAANIDHSTADILDWLAAQSGRFVPATVKPIKAENLADALARNSEAQVTIIENIATTQNAGRTIAEAKAAMRDQIARLAERGRPDIGGLFRGEEIEWPSEMLVAGGHGVHEHIVSTTVKDAFALTIWAHKAAIIAALDAKIERMGDDTTALSAEAQAARITELEATLLAKQREAEAIIEQLEASGQTVHRNCTIPEVLLGIERARQ